MPRLKKCPECGGKMERSKTKFITDTENGLIAIENIDADICSVQETVFRVAAEA